jgi:hypothetical protein
MSVYERGQRMRSTLWALILSPTIWAGHFLFCYIYAAIYCAKAGAAAPLGSVRAAVGVVTAAALAAVLVAGYVAWAKSRIPGDPPPHDESTDEDRVRFLAVSTLLLSALSFVAIVFTAVPALMFEDCR